MLDIAVQYDPVTHQADLVFNGRDFATDTTPASWIFVTLGTDRRAHPDDILPDALSNTNPSQPNALMARRGWPGDALDPQARLSGTRRWLYQRAKQTEQTRQDILAAYAEGLTQGAEDRGLDITIVGEWIARNTLGVAISTGDAAVTVQDPVG